MVPRFERPVNGFSRPLKKSSHKHSVRMIFIITILSNCHDMNCDDKTVKDGVPHDRDARANVVTQRKEIDHLNKIPIY